MQIVEVVDHMKWKQWKAFRIKWVIRDSIITKIKKNISLRSAKMNYFPVFPAPDSNALNPNFHQLALPMWCDLVSKIEIWKIKAKKFDHKRSNIIGKLESPAANGDGTGKQLGKLSCALHITSEEWSRLMSWSSKKN